MGAGLFDRTTNTSSECAAQLHFVLCLSARWHGADCETLSAFRSLTNSVTVFAVLLWGMCLEACAGQHGNPRRSNETVWAAPTFVKKTHDAPMRSSNCVPFPPFLPTHWTFSLCRCHRPASLYLCAGGCLSLLAASSRSALLLLAPSLPVVTRYPPPRPPRLAVTAKLDSATQ